MSILKKCRNGWRARHFLLAQRVLSLLFIGNCVAPSPSLQPVTRLCSLAILPYLLLSRTSACEDRPSIHRSSPSHRSKPFRRSTKMTRSAFLRGSLLASIFVAYASAVDLTYTCPAPVAYGGACQGLLPAASTLSRCYNPLHSPSLPELPTHLFTRTGTDIQTPY